tara:strand:- start:256 stop:456 length:201 start_codon:yes stop_codon:yes gene_type:complete
MKRLYIVSSPQGESRMMGLESAKELFNSFCSSKWVKSCGGQQIKLYEVKLIDDFNIEGTEPEIGFF